MLRRSLIADCTLIISTPYCSQLFIKPHGFHGISFCFVTFRLSEPRITQRTETVSDPVIQKAEGAGFLLQPGFHEADAPPAFRVTNPVAAGIDTVPPRQYAHPQQQRFPHQWEPPVP